MNFIKTFLAAILAFVVGSFLVFFLWIFILLGIAGSMEKTVAVHAESILKIDFSDVLTDAPSGDPFAGIDFATTIPVRFVGSPPIQAGMSRRSGSPSLIRRTDSQDKKALLTST